MCRLAACKRFGNLRRAILKPLSGRIIGRDGLFRLTECPSRNDLVERGFTRQPLRVDVEVARTLKRYPMLPGPFRETNTMTGATGIVPSIVSGPRFLRAV